MVCALSASLLLAVGLLTAPGFTPRAYADGDVAINAANFPDTVFRTYVSENIDADGDGYLSADEISGTTTINVSHQPAEQTDISDLKGIEYFTSLKRLDCSYNALTSLDVSSNTVLEELLCDGNKLTSLDVSSNPALVTLDCGDNKLTSLDLSNNPALKTLYCNDNYRFTAGNQSLTLNLSQNRALTQLNCTNSRLTGLDVSQNTALEELSCGSCNLTILDVSHNTALVKLLCHENPLTELDLSNNTALVELDCSFCSLTALDVSHNTALVSLFCYLDPLSGLDVSNNTALEKLECSGCGLTELDVSHNPALQYLSGSGNEFTTLDVSHNEALLGVDCSFNQLTALDVHANANLQQLICSNNNITSLDVSGNAALDHLFCDNNQLTSLDLSGNASLTGSYTQCDSQSRAVPAAYSDGMLVVDLANDLGLDMSRVSDVAVTGGTYSDGKAFINLPVESDAKITYTYDTGLSGEAMDVTLTLAGGTVTFETNGGSEVEPQTLAAGESATRPTDPTRTGYSFVDWYADPELTDGTEYDFDTPVGQDITLYAKWDPHHYTVVFLPNGGSGTMADQAFTYDVAQELSANAFARDGYHFAGWNTEADGSGTAYEDQATVENLTATASGQFDLYAQWEAHDLVKTEKVEPTCTEGGREAYWTCSVCGRHFSDAAGTAEVTDLATLDLSPLGHDFSGAWISDETGHWRVCNRCGEKSAVQQHTFGPWTHTGSHTHECTVCGYTETEDCTFGEWTVTRQPTANENGEEERTCSKCGYIEKAEIPATGTAEEPNNGDTAISNDNTSEPGSGVPNTGDENQAALWTVLILAAAGVGFLIIGRRKEL
jgi:uncharacterized repeat protein (TIGR02543 family)/LPXTG-motif cell wall-anchored protein